MTRLLGLVLVATIAALASNSFGGVPDRGLEIDPPKRIAKGSWESTCVKSPVLPGEAIGRSVVKDSSWPLYNFTFHLSMRRTEPDGDKNVAEAS